MSSFTPPPAPPRGEFVSIRLPNSGVPSGVLTVVTVVDSSTSVRDVISAAAAAADVADDRDSSPVVVAVVVCDVVSSCGLADCELRGASGLYDDDDGDPGEPIDDASTRYVCTVRPSERDENAGRVVVCCCTTSEAALLSFASGLMARGPLARNAFAACCDCCACANALSFLTRSSCGLSGRCFRPRSGLSDSSRRSVARRRRSLARDARDDDELASSSSSSSFLLSLAETALFVVVAVADVVALAVDLNNELPCVDVARDLKLRLVEL